MALRKAPDGRKLLYVVDDEKLIAEVVQQALQNQGFEVKAFSDPEAALDSFTRERRKPDALVTDYVMKPLNGMELSQRCRALSPNLRTVLFSGNVSSAITDLYAQKPDLFVPKPFLASNLARQVKELLEKRS